MGAYKDIRDQIITVLTGVQQGGFGAFAVVAKEPTTEFTGYPAVTVLPTRVDSEFITVAQNQRQYPFVATIFHPLSSENDWGVTIDRVIDLVDGCLDALDKTIDLSGKCDFLKATTAEWSVGESSQDAITLMVTLNIIAIKDINV